MKVLEFPVREERVEDAVQMLNRMGPEAVAQAALKIMESWSNETQVPPRRLRLVRQEEGAS